MTPAYGVGDPHLPLDISNPDVIGMEVRRVAEGQKKVERGYKCEVRIGGVRRELMGDV